MGQIPPGQPPLLHCLVAETLTRLSMAVAAVFLSLLTLVKFCLPSLDRDDWADINKELSDRLAPFNYHLGRLNNAEDISHMGNQINLVIREFLLEKGDIFEQSQSNSSAAFVTNKNQTLEAARAQKKILKKRAQGRDATDQDRREFWAACKAVSDLRKIEKRKQDLKSASFQEKSFNKNRWEFSKNAVRGNLDSSSESPTFTKHDADTFYFGTYNSPRNIELNNLHWFPPLDGLLNSPSFVPFNMDPIRPRDIRSILKKSNKKSAPGPDGIPYGILLKLSSTHKVLATLFTKVLQHGAPPSCWAESLIKLIHKKGSTDDPTNFRMISLTSCVGKLYHLILSQRTTEYLVNNKLIDPEIQKAFLPGINGCIEHNLTLEEIVKDARVNKRTLHITFFDLQDAFGSVPHSLIQHTLERNLFPQPVQDYLRRHYNNTKSIVVTPTFKTNEFSFKRGVFQGCPYSPIIFLLAFNPIIQLTLDITFP